MTNDPEENWIEKCLGCIHCYKRKTDDDTLRCRCRHGNCNYSPVKMKDEEAKDV